jgi:hypothetical protein
LISLASTTFFANRVASQLKALKVDEPLIRNEQVQKISTSVRLLNISVSNPFFAFTTLIATTPQTFLPTSRALRSADQLVSSTSEFLQNQKGSELKMVNAVAHLDSSLPQLKKTLSAVSQLHIGGLFSPLDKRLIEIRTDASSLLDTTTSIAPLLKIFPGISGQSSPRNYLIAFQNSAEARGTGGILGAYAVMNVDKGAAKFSAYGSNVGLVQLQDTPIPMPREFVRLYNDDPGIWQNSNISPHFPYGAQIWLALWKNQFNQDLDGVLTFDPAALSYLLKATGPIVVNGEVIDSENVVRVTLSDVYKKYLTNYKDKIVDILILEGKKNLGDQVHSEILSFSNLIYSEYFLTLFDLWLLVTKYEIPTIFISQKPILQTNYKKHEFVGYGDKNDNFVFIVIPTFNAEVVPSYKLIEDDDENIFISLDKLNHECVERINNAFDEKVSIERYLNDFLTPKKKYSKKKFIVDSDSEEDKPKQRKNKKIIIEETSSITPEKIIEPQNKKKSKKKIGLRGNKNVSKKNLKKQRFLIEDSTN